MAVILPDGSVYTQDGGVWRHVPDVPTANAMGVDWTALDAEDSLPGPQGDDWPSVDAGGGAAASSSSSGGGGFGGGDLSGILPDDLSEEGTFNSVMIAYGAEEAEGRVVLPAAAWANLRDQLVHDIPYVGNHVRARGRGLAAPVASRLWARGT